MKRETKERLKTAGEYAVFGPGFAPYLGSARRKLETKKEGAVAGTCRCPSFGGYYRWLGKIGGDYDVKGEESEQK